MQPKFGTCLLIFGIYYMRHVRMTNCQIMITCHWLIYVKRSISLVMSLEGIPIIRGNYKPKKNCRGGWGGVVTPHSHQTI